MTMKMVEKLSLHAEGYCKLPSNAGGNLPARQQNLSVKEKRALHKLITEKNKIHVINDTDKNLGPANADKSDVIKECKR